MTISNDAAQRREAARGNGTAGGQFGNQQHSAPGAGQFEAAPPTSTFPAEHRYDTAMDQLRALDNLGEVADPARKAELTREAIAAAAAVHYPTADRVALTYDYDGDSHSQVDKVFDAHGHVIALGPQSDIDEESLEFNAKIADATSYHGIPLEGTYDLSWPATEYDSQKTLPTWEQAQRFAENRARAARVREAEDAETRSMAGRLVKDALPGAARFRYEEGWITRVEDADGGALWPSAAQVSEEASAQIRKAILMLRTFDLDGREDLQGSFEL